LTQIGDDGSDESRDILLSLAKAVANTTAALVVKAKNVAATVEPQHQSNVISAATTCALTTSQLVACTKVYLLIPFDIIFMLLLLYYISYFIFYNNLIGCLGCCWYCGKSKL